MAETLVLKKTEKGYSLQDKIAKEHFDNLKGSEIIKSIPRTVFTNFISNDNFVRAEEYCKEKGIEIKVD